MIQKARPYLKRVFAMFLVLCLLMGNVPVNALAEGLGTTTETVAETVTSGTSADNKAEAEKQNAQEPDTSAPAETPPQDNGGEAENQQSSAENTENAGQPSHDAADSSQPSTDEPKKSTTSEGTASGSSVIGAPASDDSGDENSEEMTPEQEAELKAYLEAAGIDTSNLDLRSMTMEDIQKLLGDAGYDFDTFANGPGGGWKDYSSEACIRATNGRVNGIGASSDGALTYHAWTMDATRWFLDTAECTHVSWLALMPSTARF